MAMAVPAAALELELLEAGGTDRAVEEEDARVADEENMEVDELIELDEDIPVLFEEEEEEAEPELDTETEVELLVLEEAPVEELTIDEEVAEPVLLDLGGGGSEEEEEF